MKLKCLGSGSKGNCWLLENDTECLIIDAGIPIKEIKKALNFDVSKIVGVAVTHAHNDHLLSAKDFERIGIPVFKPYESDMERITIAYGGFVIRSFRVNHDDTPCCGFYITHKEMGNLLYITDFNYCKYNFSKAQVNHMIVECNYSNKYVDTSKANYAHVLRGHQEQEECMDFIRANYTDTLLTLILAHLSLFAIDYEECVIEASKNAPGAKFVDYARAGLEVEL